MKQTNITTPPPAPPDQLHQLAGVTTTTHQTTTVPTNSTIQISSQQQPHVQSHQTPQQQTHPTQPQITTNSAITPTNSITIQQPTHTATATLKTDTNNLGHKSLNTITQPIVTTQAIVVLKTSAMATSQEQQAPLALTTQPQNKSIVQTTSLTIPQIHQQTQQSIPTTIPTTTIALQQQQQRQIPTTTIKDTNNQNRTNIAPQPMITTQANIMGKTNTINSQHQEQQAPLALITQPQNKSPTTIQVSSTPSATLVTQPQIPISSTVVTKTKQDPEKQICCLLDNGVRCERFAGNASFSARIQKIVASKKMNFALDSIARHTYICDQHKALITVAKKSVPTARESKANARNLTANSAGINVVATLPPQHVNNYTDIGMSPATIQHPVNLELMANQGRLSNNHMLISMPIRPGTQIAYGHYSGPSQHPNHLNRVDHPIMAPTAPTSSYDTIGGGDSLPSSSGGIDVDLQQLQVNTLRRYKRHFRVQTRPGLNKMQLAESLKHHFRTLPIIEKEAITYFVYIVKSSRNKLDHNPKAD